jgi:hypothetical protein
MTNLETSINFQNPMIQNYLADKTNLLPLKLEPTSEVGFSNDSQDRLLNNFFPKVPQDVPFLMVEEWVVEEITLDNNGNTTGTIQSGINNIDVVLSQLVDINVEYWLYFKDGISQKAIDLGRKLFNVFDPKTNGTDIDAWIKTQLNETLTEQMFILDSCIVLEKNGGRNELNIEQRLALLRLYGQESGVQKSEIHVIGDESMTKWAQRKNVKVRQIGEYIKESQKEPAITRSVREIKKPQQADNFADTIISQITTILVPSKCGKMRDKKHKLLSLLAWPEFKIEWKTIRIKIGCTKILISIPILRVRISELIFYVYYSLPVHIDRFIFKIAETCAIRSALGAAIIGIIMSNPAAAFASFNGLFKRCLEQEIKNCVNAGLLTIKEAGEWT